MRWSLGPLAGHRDFMHLWAAQSVSAFGSRITRTALPIIAILLVTDDPMSIALLGALQLLPGVLVGLFAGGFIDRHAKRPVMIASDAARAVLVFSVPAAAWFGELGMTQLYVVAALVGASSSLFHLADNAFLPVLIGRAHLIEGNSKLETTDSVAEIGGPGLAGVLVQLLGAPLTLLIDALSYVVSGLLLARIRAREVLQAADAHTVSLLGDIRVGLRAGFGHPVIGPTFWAIAIGEFSGGFFMALYMLYALQTLHFNVATLGIVISLGGVSALAGALVAAQVARRLGFGRALVVTLAFGQSTTLLIGFAGVVPAYSVTLMAAAQLLGDGAMVAFLILANSYRQAVLPLEVMARTNGLLQVITGVLVPFGALCAGAIAGAVSISVAIWMGIGVGLLSIVPLLRRRILTLRMPLAFGEEQSSSVSS